MALRKPRKNTFTEAYIKLRDVLDFQRYQPAWQKFLTTDMNVKALLRHDGPSEGHASALDLLRVRINKDDRRRRASTMIDACKLDMIALASGKKNVEAPAFAMFDAPPAPTEEPLFDGGGGDGDTILAKENGSGLGTVGERAAALKMLSHLYRAQQRGAQNVWIYAPPMAYSQWVFDEFSGPEEHVRARLEQDDECYSATDRQTMCAALAQALKWSLDTVAKLGAPTPATRAMIKTWFADQNTTEFQITDATTKLLFGFKKIAAAANSNVLIFSDEPLDRNNLSRSGLSHGWAAFAFVRTSERMNVVYLQDAFLKAGKAGKVWLCALTIIHELSHREAKTEDKMYDHNGLRPDKTRFPFANAIINADSWAYFATDLVGMLGAADKKKVLADRPKDEDDDDDDED